MNVARGDSNLVVQRGAAPKLRQLEHYNIACDILPARLERGETPQDLDWLLFTALVDCNSMFQDLVSATPAARVD